MADPVGSPLTLSPAWISVQAVSVIAIAKKTDVPFLIIQ
jgi:hypothetical protein